MTEAEVIVQAIEDAARRIIDEIHRAQAAKDIALPAAQRHHQFRERHREDAA